MDEAVAGAREVADRKLPVREMSHEVNARASEEEAVHRLPGVVAQAKAQGAEVNLRREIQSVEIVEMHQEVAVAEDLPAKKAE